MGLDGGAAGALAAAIGVPLAMRLLARLFPAPRTPAAPTPEVDFEDLKARYRRWELGLSLAALAACVPMGFALWYALEWLAAVHAATLPPGDLVWIADEFYWALPAIFLALTLSLPIFTWVGRRLLRERYAEYLAYQHQKSAMDVERVARILFGGITVACAVFILLGLDWSVRVDRDGLVLNRYWSLGDERHPWSDVRAIRTAPALVAPNGNRVRRREFVVRFADGRTWSTNNLLAEPPPEEKARLALLLSDRSGVEIEEAELLRNEEL